MSVDHYLCSFRPLAASPKGREAVRIAKLAPFTDGSCRREPDLESDYPSISALCRSTKFAPRLFSGDRVAYITSQGQYGGEPGWALVALLEVAERFECHQEAAAWYSARGFPLPSNCMVPGNLPKPYHLTNRMPPAEVAARVADSANPDLAVRLWDATYAKRARECGVMLATRAEYLELHRPKILRRDDMHAIFGRVPGTQNPPRIDEAEYAQLARFRRLPNH